MRSPSRQSPVVDRSTGPRGRGPATRDRLVRSALEILEEDGYAGTSVLAVAERAGVAAGTLYRHFPSKAELFVEVFREVSAHEMEAIYLAAERQTGFASRLKAVISTYAGRALRNRRLSWALVYEPVDPIVDAGRLVYRRKCREYTAGLVREGIAAGELPEQDIELIAAAIVGVVAEALVGPLSPVTDKTAPDDEIITAVVTICQRAVGLRNASE